MKIRIEYKNTKERDNIIKILEQNYEIINISKEYKNRPPSKLIRVYIEVEELE